MDHKVKNIIGLLLPLLLTVTVISLTLGFVTLPIELYYGALGISFFYSLVRANYMSYRWAFFVAVLAFNCFISDAPAVFKVWERLFLFILILGTATPLFCSRVSFYIRYRTLKYLLIAFCIIGAISFFCYFAGINMMTKIRIWGDAHSLEDVGWFSGITHHSMVLAPICAFSTVYITSLLVNHSCTGKKLIGLILLLISIATAMLMAASRSAFISALVGVMVVLFVQYHDKIKKIMKISFAVILALIALYPLIAPQFEKIISKHQASILSTGSIMSSRNVIWEQRISEFKEDPIFGIGFCTVDISDNNNIATKNGTIEPGSSWLAVLSMTGVVGMAALLLIMIPTLIGLYAKGINKDGQSLMLLGLLTAIITHMFAEGYIFSGGNPLCFYFWLLLGVSSQISKMKGVRSDDEYLQQ